MRPGRGEGEPCLKGSYEAVFRGESLGSDSGRRVLGDASHISPQFTTEFQGFPKMLISCLGPWETGPDRAEAGGMIGES